jgi:hypothetical protein
MTSSVGFFKHFRLCPLVYWKHLQASFLFGVCGVIGVTIFDRMGADM